MNDGQDSIIIGPIVVKADDPKDAYRLALEAIKKKLSESKSKRKHYFAGIECLTDEKGAYHYPKDFL